MNSELELTITVDMYILDRIINHFSVDSKVNNVADYLNKFDINTVIVGVSGGIDSAVVIGLLRRIKQKLRPQLNIIAVCIDYELYGDTFEWSYVYELNQAYTDVEFRFVNLSDTLTQFNADVGIEPNRNLDAQTSYAMRYFGLFALAQQYGGITIGTTNRDEFEYAGWFGKTSDMVVDLQIISDWHKFEVVAAAKELGVPDSIINRAPSGDLIDGTTDEENFGCTYDELSYFTAFHKSIPKTEFVLNKFKKVIDLHHKNIHKYQGQGFNPIFIK